MKAIIICTLLLLLANSGRTQLWEEWFRQKETALRYSVEQVTALRAYGEALQKGYSIVQEGLHTIDRIKKGDYLQHLNYITGLLGVNESLNNNHKVADLLALQEKLVRGEQQFTRWVQQDKFLSREEKEYGQQLFQQLVKGGYMMVKELQQIISSDVFSMDDAGRLQRMGRLEEQLLNSCRFSKEVERGFKALALLRRQGEKEQGVLRQWSLNLK